MKNFVVLLLLFLTACGGGASAGNPTSSAPSTRLSWVLPAQPAGVQVSGVNVYRAGSCFAASPDVVTLAGTTTSFIDTHVARHKSYAYWVTIDTNAGESSPSNCGTTTTR
jgi:hypothetical protein